MVRIDVHQVARFADFLRAADDVQPFRFCGEGPGAPLPLAGAAGALELFFFVTAHQYGFWYERNGRYERPMIARLEGRALKGSDYLFRCCTRALETNPAFFSMAQLSGRSDDDWARLFADDQGVNPLPMWDSHVAIIHNYRSWFQRERTTPGEVVERANTAARPLAAFLEAVGRIPGYAEDPFRKKLQLLAVILEQRPERFLRVTDPESYEPIIDYHLQRSALRTGLVVVENPALHRRLCARERVAAGEEQAIRTATFEAMQQLVRRSGKSVAAIDWFFFTNRRRCPEMTAPECPACPVHSFCRRATDLFQPVFRTTAY